MRTATLRFDVVCTSHSRGWNSTATTALLRDTSEVARVAANVPGYASVGRAVRFCTWHGAPCVTSSMQVDCHPCASGGCTTSKRPTWSSSADADSDYHSRQHRAAQPARSRLGPGVRAPHRHSRGRTAPRDRRNCRSSVTVPFDAAPSCGASVPPNGPSWPAAGRGGTRQAWHAFLHTSWR